MKRVLAIGVIAAALVAMAAWPQAATMHPNQCTFTAADGGAAQTCSAKLAQTVSAGDYASLQAAINAVGANSTVVVPTGYTATLTAGLTISTTGLTLRLEPGATITKGANITMLTVTSNNVTIDGGTWDGAQASGFTGVGILANGNSFVLRNATIKNQQSQGLSFDGLNNVISGVSVQGCAFIGNVSYHILANGTVQNILIDSNYFESVSIATPNMIIAHSTTGGRLTKNITVTNNRFLNSPSGNNSFCVEIGAFGGDTPSNVVVSGNVCTSGANNYGGYSLDHVTDAVVSGNTFNMGTFTGSVAGIELVSCSFVSVTGNEINGGTGLGTGIDVNASSNNTVSGNTVNGFTTASGSAGIRLVAGGAANHADDNVISGNNVTFPATGTGLYGIWVEDFNNAGSTASRNLISNNIVRGNTQATTYGIRLQNEASAVAGTLLAMNSIDRVAVGIQMDGAATVGLTQSVGNIFGTSVTTPYGGTLTNLQRMDLVAGAVQLTSLASDPGSPSEGQLWVTGSGGASTTLKARMGSTSAPVVVTGNNSNVFQARRLITGCATAAAAGATCTTSVSWVTTFPDANYTASCLGRAITSGVPLMGGITAKAAGSVTFQTVAATAAAAQFTDIECIGIHD